MDLRDAYNLTKEISSSRGMVVYTALRKGSRQSKLRAIKVYSPLGYEAGMASTDLRVAAFLNSAQAQKKAQEAGSRNIAPIFQIGVDSIGAWYATNYYPSSLARIIAQRVCLDVEDFHHLFHSIVQGLCEFKKFTGQAHGNLKPANVLFEGRGRLRRRKVLLTDPHRAGGDETLREMSDLQALGAILWHVVRTTTHPPQWPISESDSEWKEYFGPAAEEWIKVYNQLRDPRLTMDRLNLERLRSQLPGLSFAVRIRRTARMSAPVTIPLVLVLSFASYARYYPVPKSSPVLHTLARIVGNQRVIWNDLRDDYNYWFKGLLFVVNDPLKIDKSWTNDEYFNDRVILPIEQASPYLTNLLENATPPGDEAKHIEQARKLIPNIRAALENWKKLSDLTNDASQFQQRDWKQPAGKLREVAGGVQFNAEMDKDVWRSRLRRIFGDAEDFKKCEAKWSVIEEYAGNQNPKRTASELLDEADARLNMNLAAASDLDTLAEQLDGAVDAVQKYIGTGISPTTVAEYATAQIGYSQAINREWLKQRDAIIPELANEPGREALFARLKNIFETSVHLASTNFLPQSNLPQPNLAGTAVYRLMKDSAENQRETFLTRLVRQNSKLWQTGFPADFENSLQVLTLRSEYLAWQQGHEALASNLDRLPESLKAGDHAHALESYQACRTNSEFGTLEQDPAMQPILTQIRILKQIQTNTDTSELVSYATNLQSDISFAAVMKAWERLHDSDLKPWPTNLIQIRQETAIQANIVAGLDRIKKTLNSNQYKKLEDNLLRGRNALVQDIFRTLANNENEITEALLSLREQFGADAFGDVSDSAMHFNFLLHDFRITNDFERMTVPQLKEVRDQFVQSVALLGKPFTERPELQVMSDIRKLDFDQTSPMEKTPSQLPFWSRRNGPDSLIYSWTGTNNRSYQLEFALVIPNDAPPCYLCTTELPVGLVVDWLTDHKTNVVNFIPWVSDSPTEDPRRGVRTWEPEVDTPERRPIRLSDSWQASTWTTYWEGDEPKEFRSGFGQPNPTYMSPVNYLPPAGAKFIAEALGFRLPSPSEWLAAYRISSNTGGNLRDLTWNYQREYIETNHPGYERDRPWPNQDVFQPAKVPIETDSAWRTNYNDGTLWFANVDHRINQKEDARFIQLVGNVAEYVYDPMGAGQYYVIGGSALSDPTIAVDHPYPVNPKIASKGFSDVGVRLALDAAISPTEKFRWLVARLAYVVSE